MYIITLSSYYIFISLYIHISYFYLYSNYYIFINSYHHIFKLKSYYHIFILYSWHIIFMSYYIHSVLLHGLNNALHSIASHDIEVQQVLLLIVLFPEPLSHQRFRPLVQPRDCRQKLKRDQFFVCLWFLLHQRGSLTSQWPFDHTSRFLSSNSAFFFSASCTFFASLFKSRKKTHQNTSKDIFGKKKWRFARFVLSHFDFSPSPCSPHPRASPSPWRSSPFSSSPGSGHLSSGPSPSYTWKLSL